MSNVFYFERKDRAFYKVTGADHLVFLQSMLTQDVLSANYGEASVASLCTAKGKLISDLFVLKDKESVYLDLPRVIAESTVKTLSMYVMRKNVRFEKKEDSCVYSFFSFEKDIASVDDQPTGYRVRTSVRPFYISFEMNTPNGQAKKASAEEYERFRILEGIPKFGQDITEEHFPFEVPFLGKGISYNKGCYVGQETIARVHSRGGNAAHCLVSIISSLLPDQMLGAHVLYEDKTVGLVTSATRFESGESLGLCMVHRSAIEAKASIQLKCSMGLYPGQVLQLPRPQS